MIEKLTQKFAELVSSLKGCKKTWSKQSKTETENLRSSWAVHLIHHTESITGPIIMNSDVFYATDVNEMVPTSDLEATGNHVGTIIVLIIPPIINNHHHSNVNNQYLSIHHNQQFSIQDNCIQLLKWLLSHIKKRIGHTRIEYNLPARVTLQQSTSVSN